MVKEAWGEQGGDTRGVGGSTGFELKALKQYGPRWMTFIMELQAEREVFLG